MNTDDLSVPFRLRGIKRSCIVCGVEFAPLSINQRTCGDPECVLYVRKAKAQKQRDDARAERESSS